MIDLFLLMFAILSAFAVIYWSIRNERIGRIDQQRGFLRMKSEARSEAAPAPRSSRSGRQARPFASPETAVSPEGPGGERSGSQRRRRSHAARRHGRRAR